MKVYDFYTGFEGESEIVFSINDDKGFIIIRMWETYFGNLIKGIKAPNQMDLVFNVNSIYNTEEGGWYDCDKWLIPDVGLFVKQLGCVNIDKLENIEKEILNILITLLSDSIDKNSKVFISLE